MITPQDIREAKQALGARLAALRHAAGYRQEDLAKALFVSRSTIGNIEVGRQLGARDFWEKCDHILNAAGSLLAAYDHVRTLEAQYRLHSSPGGASALMPVDYEDTSQPDGSDKENATNRRGLIRHSSLAAAGFFVDRLWSEPGRMHSALDRGCVGQETLAELRRQAADLGVRVVQTPPTILIEEALVGFRFVRELIGEKQTLSAQRELAVSGAMFATVLGEILFNTGRFPLARRWYGIAQRAATEAGVLYYADLALAGSTYLPMYSPDPRGVLDQVTSRLESGPNPSPAIAWLWGFRAKAHAMLGDRNAFQHAVDQARTVLDHSSRDLIGPGIFSFVPEKLAFYEARGWVELNDTDAAAAAAEQAIAMYDPTETTEPALAQFEKASAFAQGGELPEACRIASNALLDRRTYHGITVIARAYEFDTLVGPSNDELVRTWKQVLSSVRKPQLALPTGQEDDD